MNIYIRVKEKFRNSRKWFNTLFMKLSCRINGVMLGKNVVCCGHLYIRNIGRCKIGNEVRLNSAIWSNPIGGGNKICLQTFKNGNIEIGDGTGLSNTAITSSILVKIGKNCLIGSGCKIYDTDFHPQISEYRVGDKRNDSYTKNKEIIIEDKVFIGASSIILKGTHIGEGAIIGAGSVVSGNIPPYEIWAGNPAKYIKKTQ